MKKFLIIMLAVFALAGCSKNENSTSNSEDISKTQQETFQPDPYSITTTKKVSQAQTGTSNTNQTQNTTTTNTADTATKSSTETTTGITGTTNITETIPADAQPDPMGAGEFSYDENGALQFSQEPDTENQQLMIAAGQALFESACQTQWKFTVGCPYELDAGYVMKNDSGWVCYKIADANIHSFADIENDYYKVFSDRYPYEDLKILYFESSGSVYAMNGQREMNPYYSVSRIIDVQSQTDDEIFFTVEHQYEGNDQNPDTPYTETETFSIVRVDDKMKVGQFRLPY